MTYTYLTPRYKYNFHQFMDNQHLHNIIDQCEQEKNAKLYND